MRLVWTRSLWSDYGTQKKVHLTGSIAAVSDNEIKKSTVSTISQALVGKLPGLITQQATGAPGSDGVTMLVRGYTSYNGSSPLVLVDGVERQMGTVDPNDVENVTILKDASASAVYGMKAAAGVILITTKRGHQGSMSINYRGSVTLSQMTTMPGIHERYAVHGVLQRRSCPRQAGRRRRARLPVHARGDRH